MFRPFGLRVSVVACKLLNQRVLSTDTPAAGVSVIDLVPHRYPKTRVSVVKTL